LTLVKNGKMTVFYWFLPKIKTAGKMALFQRVLLNEIFLNTTTHYLKNIKKSVVCIKYTIFYKI